jgi:hypothetical protein
VKLYCSIHESMNGAIFVAPTPFFDVAGEGGRFALRDIPPGTHRSGSKKLPDRAYIVVPVNGVSGLEISLVPDSLPLRLDLGPADGPAHSGTLHRRSRSSAAVALRLGFDAFRNDAQP